MSLEYKGSVEGWVTNFLSKNYWKIKELMAFDDAQQEGGYVFYLMKSRYEKRQELKSDAQYMAIFKVFWKRYFIDLTKKNDKQKKFLVVSQIPTKDSSLPDSEFEESLFGIGEQSLETLILINRQIQKDNDLKNLINLFCSTDEKIRQDIRANVRFSTNKRDVLGNKFLCEKLGISTKRNLLQDLKEALQC